MNRRGLDQKGAALIVAIIFSTILVLVAGYVLTLGYNQTRQIETVGVRRTAVFYKAQAGVVDSAWRLRTQVLPPGAADFTNPPAYYIDIDTNTFSASDSASADVRVDIGPMNAVTGLRPIESTGLDK